MQAPALPIMVRYWYKYNSTRPQQRRPFSSCHRWQRYFSGNMATFIPLI